MSRIIPTVTEVISNIEFQQLGSTLANVRSRDHGALQNYRNGGKYVVCSVWNWSTPEKEWRPELGKQ